PSVTNATTSEDVQTTSGLVILPNPADGTVVQDYKITNIANGTLFLNDGVTAIHDGDFITVAEGAAGLKFTPAAHFFGTASLAVQSSTSASDAGLADAVTAPIPTRRSSDLPSVTNATTNEDVQTTSGLVIARNPADGAEVGFFKITGIANGTLF